MPVFQITDDLGKSAPDIKFDPTQPSSLLKYARDQVLHPAVVPDYLARAPQLLSAAAPNPISFQLTLKRKFQFGNTVPEIEFTPLFQATLRANATKGSSLFAGDPFAAASTVPAKTGYVSLALQGSLSLGISGTAGDLTFGFDPNASIAIEYWKAFPLGKGEPTLGDATGKMISGFVIPADVDDLNLLALNDVCTVSGDGSLTVSAGFNVSAIPNPLASVALPLNVGKIDVKGGPMAGITGSFSIRGSYQVRVRRTADDVVEISICKARGTTFSVDLSASAGIVARWGETDLLKSLLGAISTNPAGDGTQQLFADGGLSPGEIGTLTGAIKDGLDHTLKASLDLALSKIADDEAAFQYEIRPAELDVKSSVALHKALEGDLSGITAMEDAPGVKLISSVLTAVRNKQTVFKLNLIGLVNFVSVTELVRKCVVVKDTNTGYLTIADSATGNRINAQVEPLRRQEALRKAMFESLMVTATYRVSNTIEMTGLTSHNFHFVANASTKRALLADYLNWFVLMNLLTKEESEACLNQAPGGGPSTCLLRSDLGDAACRALFFESPGKLWDLDHYLDIGRRAMRAMIDPAESDKDRLRYELLDRHWPQAVKTGPNDALAGLVGLHVTDSRAQFFLSYLRGDVYTIIWWANAMRSAGEAIVDMQQYLLTKPLAGSHEFAQRRDRLQKKMAEVIGRSQTRFDEPWGLVALFWAAGSTGASARLVAQGLLLERPTTSESPSITRAAGRGRDLSRAPAKRRTTGRG
jgi:hypothetical protein